MTNGRTFVNTISKSRTASPQNIVAVSLSVCFIVCLCVFVCLCQLIGSSLLVMYDNCDCANVWMIDFAKTLSVPDHILTHRDVWRPGNHEDGYLTGLDNLVTVSQ